MWNLADVYSLETNLVPQKEMVCAKKLLIKNEAKLRISEQMKLAEEQERILQLCSFEGMQRWIMWNRWKTGYR